MIADAQTGLFDLIITKETTRFVRNTLDSIQYTCKLLAAGVGLSFQNDNINAFEEDSELRLTIMSGIAQDELRRLSSRVKFGNVDTVITKEIKLTIPPCQILFPTPNTKVIMWVIK